MKTTSLFIAALVVVSAAFGKEEPTSNKGLAVVPVKGSEIFKVIYKGETAGRVKLNLYNVNGIMVFSESFSGTDGFIRPLNFKGLEAGEYTIELVDASGKKTEKVSYNKSASASTKNIHVSKVSESDKYLLAVVGGGSEEIRVNIYDGGNNLLHTETKVVDGDYAQLYSLKNVNGTVTFEVTGKDGIVKTASF